MIKNKNFVVALLVVLGISAGAFFINQEENSTPVPTTSTTLSIPEGVSPEAVVLAALLIKNGDVAAAVEEGLISPEEVELARKAISENSLQAWIDVAENK